MIVSRLAAQRRIAAGKRPGWAAAWGLVLVDAVLLGLLMALILPLLLAFAGSAIWLKVAILFVVGFLPLQAVLIVSALWAAKSRWQLEEVKEL